MELAEASSRLADGQVSVYRKSPPLALEGAHSLLPAPPHHHPSKEMGKWTDSSKDKSTEEA